MIKIYHNPRCSKSRQTLGILEEKGLEFETVLYLENPPDADEIMQLATMLGLPVIDFIRKKEDEFKPFAGQTKTDAEWAAVIAAHPRLLERPIVVSGSKAVMGRPPENVLELL